MRSRRYCSWVLFCSLIVLSACSGSAETESNEPAAAPSEPAVALSEPAPTAAVSPPAAGDQLDCAAAEEGATCTVTTMQPPITLLVAEGWQFNPPAPNWADETGQFVRRGSQSAVLTFNVVRRVYDYPDADSLPTVVDAPTDVEGMVQFLTSRPGLRMGEPTDTTVAGRPAVQVEGELTAAPTAVASEPDSCPFGPLPGELMLFAMGECSPGAVPGEDYAGFLLVEGTRARFTVVAPEGTDRPLVITVEDQPDTFAETTAQADEMLAELQIGSG